MKLWRAFVIVLVIMGGLVTGIMLLNATIDDDDGWDGTKFDGGRLYKSFVLMNSVVMCHCEGVEPICREVPQKR